MNGTHQFQVYVGNVKILGENVPYKGKQNLTWMVSTEVGVELHTEKSMILYRP
jgi:hypothetical protein